MNETNRCRPNYFSEPQHKPRIRFVSDGIGSCYKCTDGGLTQYGNTQEEAYGNLKALR